MSPFLEIDIIYFCSICSFLTQKCSRIRTMMRTMMTGHCHLPPLLGSGPHKHRQAQPWPQVPGGQPHWEGGGAFERGWGLHGRQGQFRWGELRWVPGAVPTPRSNSRFRGHQHVDPWIQGEGTRRFCKMICYPTLVCVNSWRIRFSPILVYVIRFFGKLSRYCIYSALNKNERLPKNSRL